MGVAVVVQLLSCVWLFASPWTAARWASLSLTGSYQHSIFLLRWIKSYLCVFASAAKVLGWPKTSFGFFHMMVQQSPNELFGQLNTDWVVSTTEIYFFIVLGVRHLRPKCQGAWSPLRASILGLDDCLLPMLPWSFLCMCVCVLISSRKNSSHFGLGLPCPKNLIHLNYLCNDLFSK